MKKCIILFFLTVIALDFIFPQSSESSIFHTPDLSIKAIDNQIIGDIFTMLTYNSDYPSSIKSDGSFWQGKGVNLFVRTSIGWDMDWFSLRLAPEFWGSQNLPYDRPPQSTLTGDYWWGLDRVSLYGDGYYWTPDFGQTEIRVRQWGFTAGVGTRNVVLGPAVRQNIILSAEGSGLPMLDFGTDGRYITDWGSFDVRFFWGISRQSSFFNSIASDDLNLFTGGAISYSFPFLPDMSFGVIRAFHSPLSNVSLWKTFQFFIDTVWKEDRGVYGGGPGLEDDVDQVLSFCLDWKFPFYEARIYTEFARNDHAGNILDFLMQPDHSLAWSVGLEKYFNIGSLNDIKLSLEMADTGINLGTVVRPTGSWYRHGPVTGGYTNLGQMLGASMGPGSNFQGAYLSQRSDFYFLELGVERLINDADFFYAIYDWATQPHWKYNLMINWILSGSIKIHNWEIGTAFKHTQNWNHNFVFGSFRTNAHLEISARVNIGQ